MNEKFDADQPLWCHQLKEALNTNDPKGTTLATLSSVRYAPGTKLHGRPSARTVNIRKFDGRCLFFITDLRSGKASDVNRSNNHSNLPSSYVELCIWAHQTGKQFRLSGKIEFITQRNINSTSDTELVKKWWFSLLDREQTWFRWPHPGKERATDEQFHHSGLQVKEKRDQVADCFCVCRLEPDFVDVLDVTKGPYERAMYEKKDNGDKEEKEGKASSWTSTSVNP